MITLHRAPWVLPISSPALADGAVIVDDKQILAVGRYADLRHEEHEEIVDHEAHVLMPGLINCHCHLELSEFAELAKQPVVEPGNMPAWIADLLSLRASKGMDNDGAKEKSHATLASQHADGTDLLVDIGNGLVSLAGSDVGVQFEYFTEILGLSKQGTFLGLKTLEEHPFGHKFTCHAPYSTSSILLQAVKKRARSAGHLYPIHVAESRDELEFLNTGQGRFRTFLEERGVWDSSFAIPGTGSVNYLSQLGVLDAQTLCVHCVHLSDDEVELLAIKQAKVCLCPGSNRFLGVGKAGLEEMLVAGIRPSLGTDSLASNPQLSLWREMAILAEDHPAVEAETILAMATLHGAEALAENCKGRLEVGTTPHFLAVGYEGNDPFEFLVRDHAPKKIMWL